MSDLALPDGWMQIDPIPTDDPALKATLLIAKITEEVTVEFYEWGDMYLIEVTGPLREAIGPDGTHPHIVVAYAEYWANSDALALVEMDNVPMRESALWWKPRAGTYVDVLAVARSLWKA